VGTAQYFSPEQARGESVDARTDLYSAGVVLFELLTGMAPFRGTNPVAVAYQHVNQNPAPPSTLNSRVTPALDVVVLRSLAKDRFSRFQSATDFREEVEAAASGTVVPKKPAAEKDATLGLFGENPDDLSGSEATLRELNLADDDDQVTRTQSRPPAAWIWAGIMVMVVVVVSVLFWTVNLPSNQIVTSLSVAVPDLSGQTYDQAAASLEAKSLVPQQLSANSDTVPAGEVIRSVPNSGSDVSRQQIVKVYVSLGKATVTVPAVAGLTLEAAQAAITSRQLQVGSVTQADSADSPANIVIGSAPDRDATAAVGDAVNITVSSGAVGIPNVVGMTASQAGSTLNALQLDVTVTTTRGCSGRVVNSQSVPPGSYPQGSAISIAVCTG
jgi:beta-lactam-binding protein with PASTA domain